MSLRLPIAALALALFMIVSLVGCGSCKHKMGSITCEWEATPDCCDAAKTAYVEFPDAQAWPVALCEGADQTRTNERLNSCRLEALR
mmetsp:Transcript_70258/g.124097  ORF Transcript_70258/g.124097 Transcript_70258/m.124097 type:complete len:87 (-) Transcript_70258:109-369(-)